MNNLSKKAYVLFIVLEDLDKAKTVLEKLESIGVPGATLTDSVSGLSPSKTIFSVVPDEARVLQAMDDVGDLLGINQSSKGKSLMFTIPLVGSLGLL